MATVKQKRAAKVLVGNGGNVTQAMIAAEYSIATANTPQKLTESKGFKEIWEELIPKDFVVRTHRKIIAKTDKDGQPHSDAVKGVDMAYKVDGAYAAEKHLNVNVEVDASPEIKALTEKLNGIYGGAGKSGDGAIPGVMDDKAQDKERSRDADRVSEAKVSV